MKQITRTKVDIEAKEYLRCTIGGKVCNFKKNDDGFLTCSQENPTDSYGNPCPHAVAFTILTKISPLEVK